MHFPQSALIILEKTPTDEFWVYKIANFQHFTSNWLCLS